MTCLVVIDGAAVGDAYRIRRQLGCWSDALAAAGVTLGSEVPADAPCTAVVVVREQLDHLNALYCRRVLELETNTDFDSFVIKEVASAHYDLMEEMAPLLDRPEVDLVAVPYSRLDRGTPARTVLLAGGVPAGTVSALPDPADGYPDADLERPSGPVLVTAVRLLHKRLRWLGLSATCAPAELLSALTRLRRRAAESRWDEQPYWGWTPDLESEAVERFRAGNEDFARRVWRHAWVDTPRRGRFTRLDLASQPPAVVSDALTSIQRAVDELATGT